MSETTFHKLYLYDHIRQLLVVGDDLCPIKDNGPMNKNKIRVHKGIDNKVAFRILGPDRTPFDIPCHQQVYARLIDPDNNKVVLEKLCRLGPAKGLVTADLTGGDIATVHAGTYSMVLIRTEDFVTGVSDYYIEKPIFSDMDSNISMEIEITEQAFKSPLTSITLTPDDWTPDMTTPASGPLIKSFYSSRIPGGRVLNHTNAVHSFSTYTENFTGVLEIWGSLEETPDPYLSPTRWFKIHPSSMSNDIEFISYTGTQAWSFSANFMWLKFRLIPSSYVVAPGVMKKLIVRT